MLGEGNRHATGRDRANGVEFDFQKSTNIIVRRRRELGSVLLHQLKIT